MARSKAWWVRATSARVRVLAAASGLVIAIGALVVTMQDRPDAVVSAEGGAVTAPPTIPTTSTPPATASGSENVDREQSATTGLPAPSSDSGAVEPERTVPPAPEQPSTSGPVTTVPASGLWHLGVEGKTSHVADAVGLRWQVGAPGVVTRTDAGFSVVGPNGSREVPVPPCPPEMASCDPGDGGRVIDGWDVAGDWVAFSWHRPYGTAFGTSVSRLGDWDERVVSATENHPFVAVTDEGVVAAAGPGAVYLPDSSGRLEEPIAWSGGFIDPTSGLAWSVDRTRVVWRTADEVVTADRHGRTASYAVPRGPSADVAGLEGGSVVVTDWVGAEPTPGRVGEAQLVDVSGQLRLAGFPTGHVTGFAFSPDATTVAMARSISPTRSEVLLLRRDGTVITSAAVIDGHAVTRLGWRPDNVGVLIAVERFQDGCSGDGCLHTTG